MAWPIWAGATAFAGISSLGGQQLAAGFASRVRYAATGVQHDVVAMAPSGDGNTLWVAHQDALYRVDGSGSRAFAFALPVGHWVEALVVDRATDHVLFSDQASHVLYDHDASTGQTQAVGSVPANTFDLAFTPDGRTLLAAANPSWPSPGARPGIWRVDPGGNHREVVQLGGASGPLAFAFGGDLVCATASATVPPPPQSSRLLRFAAARVAAALAGGPALGEPDAVVVGSPLDAAFDLAIDGQERAYVTGGVLGQVLRIDLVNGARSPQPWLESGAAGTTQLAWLRGPGPATFDPFQPEGGGTLLVTIADWAGVHTEVVEVSAARPGLAVLPGNPVPRGLASVRVHGAAAGAPCILFLSELAAVPEVPWLSWNGAPLFFGLDPHVPPLVLPGTTDAAGQAAWPFVHAGPGGAAFALQALTLTASVAGTSSAVTVRLAP